MAIFNSKYKSLVHYVCWRCRQDPSKLGAVKLYKTLWAADFSAYYRLGSAISGVPYIKRQFGPVPRSIQFVLQELVSEGILTEREVSYHGYSKKEFIVLQDADPAEFSTDEIEIIDAAIKMVCEENTAQSISEQSHDRIWQSAKDGETIPYFTIFAVPGEITNIDREWAEQELTS